MRKGSRSRKVLFFATLTAPMILGACAAGDRLPSGGLIDIGTHRLEMRLEGEGSPVVVIDAGLADTMEKFASLQDRLARKTRVVVYNRAGYGQSGPGPVPRHSGREAEELKALLDKASVPGPYLLVGHSLGALNAMAFASKYPDFVAGMVLLDPPPLSFILGREYADLGAMAGRMAAEWQAAAEASAKSADAGEKTRSLFFQMIASEHREMFGETGRMVEAISTFGDLPLVVIASGKSNPAFGAVAEEYQKYWTEQSRLVADKSVNGAFVMAADSGHFLHVDAPDLVVREILSMVDRIRAEMPDAETKKSYLKCFEAVGRTISDRYFDPEFGGVSWMEVLARYRPLVAAAQSEEAFYARLNKMVFELDDSHIGVVPPDEKEQLEPVASAEASLGIDLRLLDGAAIVTSVEPGSPGEEMGLRPGFIVERIGGKTIADLATGVERIPPLHERNERKRITGKIQEQAYGGTGTTVSVAFRDSEGALRESEGTMRPRKGRVELPGGQMPPFYVEFGSRRLGDIGHIRFNVFLPPAPERFAEALESLKNIRGLILDLRGNHGGVFPVRKWIVDRLVTERRLFWRYRGRRGTRDVFTEPTKDAYAGPLVVLVDVMSASSAEEVAGGLQSIGRAVVIGERTAGICLVMDAVTLPNGALFVFPVEQTRTADGTVLESRGVIPDFEAGVERARLLAGGDAVLEAAVRYFEAKFPKGSK